jgi:flagellar protein FlgJ
MILNGTNNTKTEGKNELRTSEPIADTTNVSPIEVTKPYTVNFVRTVYPAAKKLYNSDPKNYISPLFVTAQAALETGWKINDGNNIFGITKGAGWRGKTRLVLTTDYFSTPDKKFLPQEKIVSINQIDDGRYKYNVYRMFRAYDKLEDCLHDHLTILRKSGYADAWPYRNDPIEYAKRISDSIGSRYATAPNYEITIITVIRKVKTIIKSENL